MSSGPLQLKLLGNIDQVCALQTWLFIEEI